LAAYVQGHHQDSVTILLSSGFQASRRPSPVALPVVPANARLTAGSVSGSVVLRTQKSANADNSSPRFFCFFRRGETTWARPLQTHQQRLRD
jgi:hypothetical protein